MPQTTFLGHPLHPQVIVLPAGLMPFSFAMDLLYLATGRRTFRDAAYWSLAGGVAGGAAAGATGAMDYLTIPAGSPEKRTANIHAGINLALIAGAVVNLALRTGGADARSRLPLALSTVAALGVVVSGWYGGHLVYEHGLRVRGRSLIERAPQARVQGDARLERGFETVDRWMTARGPVTRWGSRNDQSAPRS
jgi:uncharacterized membrane protein